MGTGHGGTRLDAQSCADGGSPRRQAKHRLRFLRRRVRDRMVSGKRADGPLVRQIDRRPRPVFRYATTGGTAGVPLCEQAKDRLSRVAPSILASNLRGSSVLFEPCLGRVSSET